MRLSASAGSAGRRAFLAIPAVASVHPQLTICVADTVRAFAAADVSLEVEVIYGHCHVDDCRNLLVRDFLESEATDMLCVDADVGWNPTDLLKMLFHPGDVVGAVYPYKSDNLDFPCTLLGGEIWSDENGLIEVAGIPGGFMRLTRYALNTLWNMSKQYLNHKNEVDRKRVGIIFERTLEDDVRYSGDYAFCRKWRALGGKVHVDPSIRLSHFGDKEYRGCYGDFLKARAGLGFEKLDLIVAGKEDDDTLIALFEEWGNQWAGGPEFQQAVLSLSRETRGPILEFGSGLSTLVMAAANPDVHIHALESDQGWASKLTDVLEQRKMQNVTVHMRPLVQYPDGRWYDLGDLPRMAYSLVVIDGPARSKGERGVWFQKAGELARHAVWIMDDADDPAQLYEMRKFADGGQLHVFGDQRRFAISMPELRLKAA